MASSMAWGVCLLCFCHRAVAQVRVLSPNAVAQQFLDSRGRIQGSTATFGAPFYGDRILGRLFWADSKANNHCTEDDYEVPTPAEVFTQGESGTGRLINIFMVRRGNCSFTKKVQIAANKGAHAVIFVDREDSRLTANDMHHIIVADDGYGGSIRIPSVLISKSDGAHLIAAVKKTQVVIELKWDIPTNKVVEMDLWMSSGSRESMKFLKEFSPMRKALNEVVKFRPHYYVFRMPSSDPGVYNDLCSDSTGQYCAEDPDGSGSITGKMVLEEDVRQLCIHELTKVQRTSLEVLQAGKEMVEYAKIFWDYVEKFSDACPLDATDPENRFGTQCAERLMRKVGLDVEKVQDCISNTTDTKLKHERENTAWSSRALRINGWRYSGMMDADLVTRAICSGFISRPLECKVLLTPTRPAESESQSAGLGIATALTTFLVVSILGVCVLLLYKRHLKTEMSATVREQVYLEVHNQMSQYSKMPANF